VSALKAMYNSVKSCGRYNSELSTVFNYSAGIKQGDPSSPLLAIFSVNDIMKTINSDLPGTIDLEVVKLFLLMYTDYKVLFSKSPESLKAMLKDVENYCNKWV